jgi:hypothetical protein
VNETSIAQDLQVMGNGRLALAQWLHEVAHADLAIRGSGEDAQNPESHRVGQSGEAIGKLSRLGGIKRGGQ